MSDSMKIMLKCKITLGHACTFHLGHLEYFGTSPLLNMRLQSYTIAFKIFVNG